MAIKLTQIEGSINLEVAAQEWLIRTYIALGKITEAKSACESLIKKCSNTPEYFSKALCCLGSVEMAEGKLSGAEADFLKAQKVAVDGKCGSLVKAEPMIGLGTVYFHENRLTQAEQCDEDALKLARKGGETNGVLASLTGSLARIYYKNGKIQHAENAYKTAIGYYQSSQDKHSADYADLLSQYASLLSNCDRLEEAEHFFEKAFLIIDSNKHIDNSISHYCREKYSALLRKLGREEEAKKIERTAE